MEVSQAIWLALFFTDALLISPKRFDEIILDFYQDAGIWIVIASCVAEYLLLLTYIGVAAYDFFKNRKMMKKMNVQRRTYEFLKFDESHRDVGNRWREPVSAMPGALGLPNQNRKGKGNQIRKQKLKSLKKQKRRGQLRNGNGLEESSKEPIALKQWSESNNAPNNPQLLKFDGDAMNAQDKRRIEPATSPMRARRMNKSLKRKQIE